MQAAALILEVARAADDDFNQIVRRREAQLLRIAFRILGNWADAEDVAQEAFFRLHRHGLNFANDAALDAWLYRVTVNLCIDRSRHMRPEGELPELMGAGPSAESAMLQEERRRLLSEASPCCPRRNGPLWCFAKSRVCPRLKSRRSSDRAKSLFAARSQEP